MSRSIWSLFAESVRRDGDCLGQGHKPQALSLLSDAWALLTGIPWQPELIKTALEEAATKHHLKLGKAQAPVRVTITGRTVGLPLFEYGSPQPRPVAVGRRSAISALSKG